jgi:hypothetical protein
MTDIRKSAGYREASARNDSTARRRVVPAPVWALRESRFSANSGARQSCVERVARTIALTLHPRDHAKKMEAGECGSAARGLAPSRAVVSRLADAPTEASQSAASSSAVAGWLNGESACIPRSVAIIACRVMRANQRFPMNRHSRGKRPICAPARRGCYNRRQSGGVDEPSQSRAASNRRSECRRRHDGDQRHRPARPRARVDSTLPAHSTINDSALPGSAARAAASAECAASHATSSGAGNIHATRSAWPAVRRGHNSGTGGGGNEPHNALYATAS